MLSISPVVSPTGSSTDFRQLLIQQRREVLDAWVEEQLKQGRVESLPAAELREQCDQFLSLLAGPASSDSILVVNAPAWMPARAFLADLSRSRAPASTPDR